MKYMGQVTIVSLILKQNMYIEIKEKLRAISNVLTVVFLNCIFLTLFV